MAGRAHDEHPVHVREEPERRRLVRDTVLGAHDRRRHGGAVAARRSSTAEVCWLFTATIATSPSRQSISAGSATAVTGRVPLPSGQSRAAARRLHGGEVWAPGDEDDLVAGVLQVPADHATDGAGSVDDEAHPPSLPQNGSRASRTNSRSSCTSPCTTTSRSTRRHQCTRAAAPQNELEVVLHVSVHHHLRSTRGTITWQPAGGQGSHSRTRKAPRPAGSVRASASWTRLRPGDRVERAGCALGSPAGGARRPPARRARGCGGTSPGPGRASGRRTSASWSTATSQVMSQLPGASSGSPPGRARRRSGPTRPTDDGRATPSPTRSRSRPAAHRRRPAPGRRRARRRRRTGPGGGRRRVRPYRPGPRTTGCALGRAGRGSRPGSTSRRPIRPGPPTHAPAPVFATRANGRLSSSSLASTTTGPVTELARRRGAWLGSRRPADGSPTASRPGSTSTRRSALLHRGVAARTDRASVPGPAPASTTTYGSGRPRSSHHESRARATTAPKSGPTSGEVRKSRRRPAPRPEV